MKKLTLLSAIVFSTIAHSQNVSINATGAAPNASSMLDVSSTTSGFLLPRMTNAQRLAIVSPAIGLAIYQTDAGTTGAGFYFYNGGSWTPWSTTNGVWGLSGNTGTTPTINFIGTTDNNNFITRTNNIERIRVLNTGQISFNNAAPSIATDFLTVTSSSASNWAINAYNAQTSGSGVFVNNSNPSNSFSAIETRQASSTGAGIYAISTGTIGGTAVAGTYSGSASGATGVAGNYTGGANGGAGTRGILSGAGNGSGFSSGSSRNGVVGQSTATGSYKFGVHGTGGNSIRSGGVMGVSFFTGLVYGALGYRESSGTEYSVYGFTQAHTNGIGGGRLAANNNSLPTRPIRGIGMGIYGGVMGGWIKGLVYGTNFSGEKYGIYVHGNSITNDQFIQLNTSSQSDFRIPSYATTSLTHELTAKGKITLVNGSAIVTIDQKLIDLCDLESIIITATPMGECNGVFIKEINAQSFILKELNHGTSNASISYIISGTLKNTKPFEEQDILNKKYEINMNGVMHNDYDDKTSGTSIWYDGEKIRHDVIDETIFGKKENTIIEYKEPASKPNNLKPDEQK